MKFSTCVVEQCRLFMKSLCGSVLFSAKMKRENQPLPKLLIQNSASLVFARSQITRGTLLESEKTTWGKTLFFKLSESCFQVHLNYCLFIILGKSYELDDWTNVDYTCEYSACPIGVSTQ